MPDSKKPPRPWTMPDSAYNANSDEEPAYFAIKQTSIQFHGNLKSKAELKRRGNPKLDLKKHFDPAFKKVISDLAKENRKPLDLVLGIFGELSLVLAGVLVTPIANEFINWFSQPSPRGPFEPTSLVWAGLGVLLIVVKLVVNYLL